MKLKILSLVVVSTMTVLFSTKANAQTVSEWLRLVSDDWCMTDAHCAPYPERDESIVESRCNLSTPRFPDSPNGEGLCEFKVSICDDGNVATTDVVHPVTGQCGNWAPTAASIRTLSGWSRLPSDDTCNSENDCQPTLGRDASITATRCTARHQCQFRQYVCDDSNGATQDVINPRNKECGIWVPYHVPVCDACNSCCGAQPVCGPGLECLSPPEPCPTPKTVCELLTGGCPNPWERCIDTPMGSSERNGCVECTEDDDCWDGEACSVETCNNLGICEYGGSVPDGTVTREGTCVSER